MQCLFPCNYTAWAICVIRALLVTFLIDACQYGGVPEAILVYDVCNVRRHVLQSGDMYSNQVCQVVGEGFLGRCCEEMSAEAAWRSVGPRFAGRLSMIWCTSRTTLDVVQHTTLGFPAKFPTNVRLLLISSSLCNPSTLSYRGLLGRAFFHRNQAIKCRMPYLEKRRGKNIPVPLSCTSDVHQIVNQQHNSTVGLCLVETEEEPGERTSIRKQHVD